MRRDFLFALILGLAALPAGLAVSEGIEYFPYLRGHPGVGFWGSSAVTVLVFTSGVIIAIKGERQAEREGVRRRMLPFIGMLVFGSGFIVCVAWYFWPRIEPELSTDSPPAETQALFLECSSTVPILPPNGKAFSFPAIGMSKIEMRGGFEERGGPPGSLFLRAESVPFVYKCDLVNYLTTPIINVEMSFHLIYRSIKKLEQGGRIPGDIIFSGLWPINISKIDSGAANSFTFFSIMSVSSLLTSVFRPRPLIMS
jgi:hypothetical protein